MTTVNDNNARLGQAIAALEELAEARIRDGLGRYGIVTADRVLGVAMANVQKVARAYRKDHALAEALWGSGIYEARLMATYVDDPALVTPAQMDRWAREFDNWATCDTLCFKLFDRTAAAFDMVDRWATDEAEFVKRAAFALLASLAQHDKKALEQPFLERLPLIEAAATDGRNFVKKGVSWALRGIGGKKNPVLRAAARDVADRLATSPDKSAKWVGRDAQKEFAKADASHAKADTPNSSSRT
jgi:3-methyladenine DNA glycosylase AlkD